MGSSLIIILKKNFVEMNHVSMESVQVCEEFQGRLRQIHDCIFNYTPIHHQDVKSLHNSCQTDIAWIHPNNGSNAKKLFFHHPNNTLLRLLLRRDPLYTKSTTQSVKLEKKVRADIIQISQMNGVPSSKKIETSNEILANEADRKLLALSLANRRLTEPNFSPILVMFNTHDS